MNLDIGLAARVVAGIRTETARHTGCKEWDTAGIAKALRETEGSPGAVLAAACLAAEDAKLERPSAAGFRVCWPVNAVTQPRVTNNIPCPEHPGLVQPCGLCREGKIPPPADVLATIRQTLAEAPDLSDKAARERLAQKEQR